MSTWTGDVEARRRIRVIVDELVKTASALGDDSAKKLHEAAARLFGKDRLGAENASADLSLAAHKCGDPDLRGRIEAAQRDLEELLYESGVSAGVRPPTVSIKTRIDTEDI